MILKVCTASRTYWFDGIREAQEINSFNHREGEDPAGAALGDEDETNRPLANVGHVLDFRGHHEDLRGWEHRTAVGKVIDCLREVSGIGERREWFAFPANCAFLVAEESGKTIDRL